MTDSDQTITIVSGFGRCGSSLVMQMLEAGGMPVTGGWPAFEAPECAEILGGGTLNKEWLASIPGHAIKVLDPQNGKMPALDCRIIWCSRDRQEQAASQVKFASMMFGVPNDRATRRKFAESYQRDKPKAVRTLLSTGTAGIMEVQFEDILHSPMEEARKLAAYCDLPASVIEKMAGAVRRRSILCAPGMDMEIALMAEREAA